MRITEIKITQKAVTGQYEYLELTVSAGIDEEDNMAKAAEDAADFVDWVVRRPLRDAQLRTQQNILAHPESTEDAKTKAEKWIAKYTERKARVEAL